MGVFNSGAELLFFSSNHCHTIGPPHTLFCNQFQLLLGYSTSADHLENSKQPPFNCRGKYTVMKCFAIVAIAALVFATVQAEENNIPLITRSCTFEQISNANECEQSCQQDQPNSINFDWDDSIPKCDCLFAGGSPATLCSGVDDDEEDNDVPTRGELRRQLNLNLDMQCSSQVDRAVTGTFYNCFVKTYEDNDDAEEDDAIKCTFNKCENEFYRFTRILSGMCMSWVLFFFLFI